MRISYIELMGNRYPLCFSLSAAEELGEKFGDLEKMNEAIGSSNLAGQAKAIDTIMTALMDAGRRYCKIAGMECPDPLPCRPSDIIDLSDPEAVSSIFNAISVGKEREVEAKNSKAMSDK